MRPDVHNAIPLAQLSKEIPGNVANSIVPGHRLARVNTSQLGRSRVIVAGQELPTTLSTTEAAGFFGCSPERLQKERGTGRLPVEPLNLGHRLRWPTVQVLQAVGLPFEVVRGDDDRILPEGAEVHDLAQVPNTDPGGS
jgi:hypothetical protein